MTDASHPFSLDVTRLLIPNRLLPGVPSSASMPITRTRVNKFHAICIHGSSSFPHFLARPPSVFSFVASLALPSSPLLGSVVPGQHGCLLLLEATTAHLLRTIWHAIGGWLLSLFPLLGLEREGIELGLLWLCGSCSAPAGCRGAVVLSVVIPLVVSLCISAIFGCCLLCWLVFQHLALLPLSKTLGQPLLLLSSVFQYVGFLVELLHLVRRFLDVLMKQHFSGKHLLLGLDELQRQARAQFNQTDGNLFLLSLRLPLRRRHGHLRCVLHLRIGGIAHTAHTARQDEVRHLGLGAQVDELLRLGAQELPHATRHASGALDDGVVAHGDGLARWGIVEQHHATTVTHLHVLDVDWREHVAEHHRHELEGAGRFTRPLGCLALLEAVEHHQRRLVVVRRGRPRPLLTRSHLSRQGVRVHAEGEGRAGRESGDAEVHSHIRLAEHDEVCHAEDPSHVDEVAHLLHAGLPQPEGGEWSHELAEVLDQQPDARCDAALLEDEALGQILEGLIRLDHVRAPLPSPRTLLRHRTADSRSVADLHAIR
mmetsp:Transcript_22078/g.62980  ORF Transcript_22078/g.62980 Transcript_22078/m.62980 type:complete len:540 (+) Transcript_22078:2256-3875(+)